MSSRYEKIWKTLLERGKLSVRCKPGELETATLIRAVGKEKNLDRKNRERFLLRSRVDREDKNKVNFELKRKINILNV